MQGEFRRSVGRNPAGAVTTCAELSNGRSRETGCLLLDQQQHLAMLDPDRKGPDVVRHRFQHSLSGRHVKPALMKRAFDFVAFEESLAKPGMAVGADVRGCVDLALNTVESDVLIADLDRDDVAFGHIGPRRYGQPFSTHRHLGKYSCARSAADCVTGSINSDWVDDRVRDQLAVEDAQP